MFESLKSSKSALRTGVKEELDHIFSGRRDMRPIVSWELVVHCQYFLEDLFGTLTGEGRVPTQENVEEHAHTPHIGWLVIFAPQHLGSHVVRSAHDRF